MTRDVVDAMAVDSGLKVYELRVDGGASRNNFLMQFQSDILGLPVARPKDIEVTAKGVAFLAGLATDFWGSTEELRGLPVEVEVFQPRMGEKERRKLYGGWKAAVRRVINQDSPSRGTLERDE
jgi:glycerol kinase